GFKLFPNPAENFVIVEISNPKGKSLKLELMDILGRILFTQDAPSTITAKCTINTSGYLPGIYLIRVGDEQTLGTQPFLIKNLKP
ncbi:MAG: T9SS type A sorting domain-containing protein, partial [Bacteroidia bacterium]|nr:T9SS type A sorting domain-containing protein [Bacteroidia bacterium]